MIPTTIHDNLRLRALNLLLEEFEYPNRELRLVAQCLNCKREVEDILSWLRAEIRKEIDIETMFDEVRETEPPVS